MLPLLLDEYWSTEPSWDGCSLVLLLWIVERTIVSLAFQGLGLDYRWQDVEVERGILEAVLPVDNVIIPGVEPFLDLLVALSIANGDFHHHGCLGRRRTRPPKMAHWQ